MQITRLRVSGFKSFSDPVELQLDPGLTGVVGPNGCGKSNIVEALRWAMGESSAKGLRGDEMDDVIFNGSSGRPAHDVAEVRLKLRGRPEGLTGFTEEEELEIARRIGRGSGSSYRINGREARARDVQLLFADAGAGSRSPAIVGQGQIGFIVDSKAGDRRKLLEDAAGIGGLQARRREAELRLEATQANLQRVLDLLGTQEARLADLAKQAKQAQRYRQVSAELRATEAQLLLGRHVEASRRAAAANEEVASLQAEHGTVEAEAERLRRACAEATATLPPLREQAAALQAEVTGMQERLGALQAAAGREAEHLAALQRQRDEAARDLAQSEAAVAQLAASLAALTAERAELERLREQAQAELARLEIADRAAAAALAQAQDVLRTAHGEAAEAVARHEAAAARHEAIRQRGEAVAAELQALPPPPSRQRLSQAEAALAAGEARLAAARVELVELAARLAALTPAQETAREAHLAAEREMVAGRERLSAAELRVREAGAVLDRWTERQAANERTRARLAERTAALARRRELHEAAEVDPAVSEAELASAEAELAAADRALDGARETLAAAEHARTETAGRLRGLRRSADALAAEIRVLESLIPPGSADSLLERLEVPEELGTALAAALGDELLAGTDPAGERHWGASATALARPALPGGATPLASLIGAPDILRARLARTGLIDAEEAGRLQPLLPDGHCLVSRDGGLWRWDGYVHAPGGETQTAAGIRHQLRLHAAREELAALGSELAAAEAAAEAGEATARETREALGEHEARWRAADAAQLRARHRVEEARSLAERRAVEAGQLVSEERALKAEAAELAEDAAPDHASAALIAEREAAEAASAAARGEAAELERGLGVARQAADAASKALAAAAATRRALEATTEGEAGEVERCRATVTELARSVVEEEASLRARAEGLQREAVELAERALSATAELAAAQELRDALVERRSAAAAACDAAERGRQAAGDVFGRGREEALRLEGRVEAVAQASAETEQRLAEDGRRVAELSDRGRRLAGELGRAEADSRSDPAALAELERLLAAARDTVAAARRELEEREAAAARLAEVLAAATATAGALRERFAVAQSERSHAHEALAASVAVVRDRLQQEPLALLADEALRTAVAAADIGALDERLARLRASRERLGAVNLRAEIEAAELEATLAETRGREAELQEAVARLRAGIGTLDKEARERLLTAFEAVDGHFRRLFTTLFGGGRAHLRLSGADDPLRAGLELEASPPGKKLSSISLLSGGEKTLTALALVFGFFLAQPSPLCVLDEVDAPLDDANVDRFVGLMQEIAQSTGTRFLVVTHHPLTMARMHRLFGVTMAERGVSRLVSVALEQALEMRATA